MDITIRPARADDLDAVARVLCAAFEPYRWAASTPAEREALDRHLTEVADVGSIVGESELFVASAADRIVGAAMLEPPNRPGPPLPGPCAKPWPRAWASLRRLGVEPAYRGRGVGSMLVDARLARARELGATAALLHTSPIFAVVHGMVGRHGWQRVPEWDFSPAPHALAEAYLLAFEPIGERAG